MKNIINSNIVQTAKDLVLAGMGHPVKIRAVLRQNPQLAHLGLEPAATASLDSSVDWAQFGENPLYGRGGVLFRSRRASAQYQSGYQSGYQRVEALTQLVTQQRIENGWSCGLADIGALRSSKSPLSECADLDEFAKEHAADLLNISAGDDLGAHTDAHGDPIEIAREKARAKVDTLLKAHPRPFGIFKPDRGASSMDHLVINAWELNPRIGYDNDDGSHRFAAARLIAREAGLDYRVEAPLKVRSLNKDAVMQLSAEFNVMAIPPSQRMDEHGRLASTGTTQLLDALDEFGALYGVVPLPPGPDGMPMGEAILLPKSDPKSEPVARAMRDAGVTDVCKHLHLLCALQYSNDRIMHLSLPVGMKPMQPHQSAGMPRP